MVVLNLEASSCDASPTNAFCSKEETSIAGIQKEMTNGIQPTNHSAKSFDLESGS